MESDNRSLEILSLLPIILNDIVETGYNKVENRLNMNNRRQK